MESALWREIQCIAPRWRHLWCQYARCTYTRCSVLSISCRKLAVTSSDLFDLRVFFFSFLSPLVQKPTMRRHLKCRSHNFTHNLPVHLICTRTDTWPFLDRNSSLQVTPLEQGNPSHGKRVIGAIGISMMALSDVDGETEAVLTLDLQSPSRWFWKQNI